MRAALREARTLPTSVGRLSLRMSTGIHSGTFNFFRVGESHFEFLVGGPAASTTTRMEHGADAGEIVVSDDTAARLPPRACGDAKAGGRLLKWRKVVDGGPGPQRCATRVQRSTVRSPSRSAITSATRPARRSTAWPASRS